MSSVNRGCKTRQGSFLGKGEIFNLSSSDSPQISLHKFNKVPTPTWRPNPIIVQFGPGLIWLLFCLCTADISAFSQTSSSLMVQRLSSLVSSCLLATPILVPPPAPTPNADVPWGLPWLFSYPMCSIWWFHPHLCLQTPTAQSFSFIPIGGGFPRL